MNYQLHKNGWTVIIDDFDMSCASNQELFDLAKLCSVYTCVKIRNQCLTIDRELEIIKSFENEIESKLYSRLVEGFALIFSQDNIRFNSERFFEGLNYTKGKD